jgi:hypothetical protein
MIRVGRPHTGRVHHGGASINLMRRPNAGWSLVFKAGIGARTHPGGRIQGGWHFGGIAVGRGDPIGSRGRVRRKRRVCKIRTPCFLPAFG